MESVEQSNLLVTEPVVRVMLLLAKVLKIAIGATAHTGLTHDKKRAHFNSYLGNGQILRTYFLILPKFHLIPPKNFLFPR